MPNFDQCGLRNIFQILGIIEKNTILEKIYNLKYRIKKIH
jgi:hypothetical protein